MAKMLQPLRAAMTVPELVRFGDGHYRRVVYGLGPYIADYEEQVLLACIVRGWCGK
jgi:Plavaka transposase